MTKCTFAVDEQAIQLRYFERHLSDRTGLRGRAFQLQNEHRLDGLLPEVREASESLFRNLNIQWHTYIGHGRSSQACCLNFLMPLANRRELLSRWVSAVLNVEKPQMLPIEGKGAGEHKYVAFEYTGPGGIDYLGEANGGVPQRGAHATASDAAVAFTDSEGRKTLVLIEWKYTENYRNHRLSADLTGKRFARYGDKLLQPNGPIRADLGLTLTDFLREPFYQLVRQQMLAFQIEKNRSCGFNAVKVLHLSPAGNKALHSVTIPAIVAALEVHEGFKYDDAFLAYQACLADSSRFVSSTIEDAFRPLGSDPDALPWFEAVRERYPTLCPISAD